MEQSEEIVKLRKDVNNLKEIVETIAIMLNKKLMIELYGESDNIRKGDFYTEEEFAKRHKIRIH